MLTLTATIPLRQTATEPTFEACIYAPEDDVVVSKAIAATGKWEGRLVNHFSILLNYTRSLVVR